LHEQAQGNPPRCELLTIAELDRICTAFVRRGVKHLRLTGGEPLMRRGIMDLVHGLSQPCMAARCKN